jgi:DNA polymerase I-like protein with 3'-5' exonuclease and polymerase domains
VLKGGIFVDKTGSRHSVYEVDQTNFYRLDICEPGAEFHVEPDKVEFSIVRRKTTSVIGKRFLHSDFESLRDVSIFSNLNITNTDGWEEGRYVNKELLGNGDNMFCEMVYVDGRLESETYKTEDRLIVMSVISRESTMTFVPMNIGSYLDISIPNVKVNYGSNYLPLSVLRVRYDIEHLFDMDMDIISGEAEARDYLNEILNSEELVGFDFESTGTEFNIYDKDEVVGIVISDTRKRSRYFPFRHEKFENLPLSFIDEIIEVLSIVAKRLRDILYDTETEEYWDKMLTMGVGAFNKKFEKKVLLNIGYKDQREIPMEESITGLKEYELTKQLDIFHDPFLLSRLVNPVNQRGVHQLKNLKYEESNKKFLEMEDICPTKEIHIQEWDRDLVKAYACPDALNLKDVLYHLWDKYPKYSRKIYRLECELADLKSEQEFWGLRIDAKKFEESRKDCDYIVNLLEKAIHALSRSNIKISSSDQLADLLYNKMGCKVYVYTKKNKKSTGTKAIKKLASIRREQSINVFKTDIRNTKGKVIIKASELNKAEYPIVLLIDKYKEYLKLKTSFYSRISKKAIGIVEDGVSDYRYNFWIDQNGATTGRQSSEAHQLPLDIKECILADSEDHRLYNHDYCQIELRLLFSQAGELDLVEMCKIPSNDIHRVIDNKITGIEMWAISADMRKKGKTRNFGVVYLISEFGLAVQLNGAGASEEQIKEAKVLIDDFFKSLKRVAKFIRDNREELDKYGYVTTAFGRNKYFFKIFDKDYPAKKKASLYRQANNVKTQGTAADIMKHAEVNLKNYIKDKKWDRLVDTPQGRFPLVRTMLSIHDEVLVSGHKSIPAEEILEMHKKCMELTIKGYKPNGEPYMFAPLFTSGAIVNNWREGKEDSSLEIPYELREKIINDYISKGTRVIDMDNPVDCLRKSINKFRENEIIEYMEGLIKEHGANAESLYDKVRHPSLTHELVARFHQSKEEKDANGKLSHIESIEYAVRKYLEFRNNPDNFEAIETSRTVDDTEHLDFETETLFEEISGLGEEVGYYDDQGNLMNNNEDTEEEEEDYLMWEEDAAFIERLTSNEPIYYWEFFDSICVSPQDMSIEDCDKLLELIFKYRDPKGFYKVMLEYGDKLIDTKITVERLDKKEIVDFIKEHQRKKDDSNGYLQTGVGV